MSGYNANRSIADWTLWAQADELNPEDFGPFTERQSALFWFQIGLTQAFGKYDQSMGPDGCHYVGSAENPWLEQGVSCGQCAFFEGGRTCEIVDGTIDQNGLCKFWVIPEGAVTDPNAPAQAPPGAAKPAAKPKMAAEWEKKKPKKSKKKIDY